MTGSISSPGTMARKRSASPTGDAASRELGHEDYATHFTSKGRAIRKCRTKQVKHALDDDEDEHEGHFLEDDDDVDDLSDESTVALSHKRKRTDKKTRAIKRALPLSPTRELPYFDNLRDASLTSDDEAIEPEAQSPFQGMDGQVAVHLTVNIPLNHSGPITLNLDPKAFISASLDKRSRSTLARLSACSKSTKSKFAGFLDLPAELKNLIYRDVFVADRPLRFGRPVSFSRTSALLRTCKQVHVCRKAIATRRASRGSLDATLTYHRKKDEAFSTQRTCSLLNVGQRGLEACGLAIGRKLVT